MDNAERAQQRLADRGVTVKVDGDWGGGSFAALMCFIAGKRTASALQLELGRAAARHFPSAGIDTPLRIAHALAQQSVETNGFSQMVENLNYSVKGLRTTFGKARISDADCQRLGRRDGEPPLSAARQEAIANLLYGGPFGLRNLGNTAPGDGWKYRGRGAKQTTGLHNYDDVADLTGLDVVATPAMLEDPDLGMQAACIYWEKRNCNPLADADDAARLTLRINGGSTGLDRRKAALVRARQILL